MSDQMSWSKKLELPILECCIENDGSYIIQIDIGWTNMEQIKIWIDVFGGYYLSLVPDKTRFHQKYNKDL